ncbi:MAG TPA: ComEC/Rec2 family competence protein [Gemmatimonadales bacterium]
MAVVRRGVGLHPVRWLTPVALSAGAVLATAPIQALAFGTLTPIGVLSNLIAIPLATFTTPALALALLLGTIPGAMPAAALAASAAGLGLDGLEQIAATAQSGWGAGMEIARPLFVAVLLAIIAIWLLRAAPRRLGVRPVFGWRLTSAGLAVIGVFAWSPMLRTGAAPDGDGRLTLHFLDVGQGDAEAIRTPHGHWIVVDGGPREAGRDEGARKVVPMLRRNGAETVDIVVASHGDADHMGGLPAVLTSLPSGLVMEPGTPLGRPLYVEWLADIAKDHAHWHPARAGDSIQLDGVTIRVWHPDSATIAANWDPNENSVVLTIEYGGFRALLGGDAGLPMEALRAKQIGAVTVLKVGHHGSRSATSDEWLAALKPAVCVIEVGAHNKYGHPDPGTVARLGAEGCSLFRTDRDGDVDVSTDGRQVTVRAAARDTTLVLCEEQPCGHR